MRHIYLLDLNYTLIQDTDPNVRPMERRIATETYKEWLIELLRPEFVILVTARPEKYRDATLQSIAEKTVWQPQAAFFNSHNEWPPAAKKRMLEQHIFPEFGDHDGARYYGLESNPRTRAMYESFGIESCPVPKEGGWDLLPTNQLT